MQYETNEDNTSMHVKKYYRLHEVKNRKHFKVHKTFYYNDPKIMIYNCAG